MSEDSTEVKGNGKLSDSQLKRARVMIDSFSGVPRTRVQENVPQDSKRIDLYVINKGKQRNP